MKSKNFLLATAILVEAIIGAGIFALPFVFRNAGLSIGFFYLVVALLAYIFIYLMYADIISATKGDHRFVGYARIHLGESWSWLAILMTIVEAILVLTIYLILSQSFGDLIVGFGQGIDKMVIFWLLGSAALFLGFRLLADLEFAIAVGTVGIIGLIAGLAIVKGRFLGHVSIEPQLLNYLLPFGPILFALSGRVAIPIIMKFKGVAKKAIVWGTIISAILYGIFVLSALALSPAVSEDAVSGLIGFVPPWALFAIGILGLLELFSSYIIIGYDAQKSMELDLKLPWLLRFGVVIFAPLILFFSGFTHFIELVSFVGGIFVALESILIVLMWLKVRKSNLIKKPLLAILILIFEAALLYEIIKYISNLL